MNTKIITPCLYKLLQFYGYTSVQLLPYSFAKQKNVLNFCWNLFLFSVTLFKFLILNLKYLDGEKTEMTATFNEKPLFSILYNLAMRNDFTLVCLLNFSYFAILNYNNSKLLNLLDSFNDLKVFQSQQLARKIIIFHQILFFLSVYGITSNIFITGQWTEAALQYVSIFFMNMAVNAPFILLYYYKYATLKSLEGVANKLRIYHHDNVSKTEATFKAVVRELSRLGFINSQLNYLLSLPLMLSMVPYTTEMIITLACLLFQKLTFESAYLFQIILHMIVLSWLETKIDCKLKNLTQLLRGKTAKSSIIFRTKMEVCSSQDKVNESFYTIRCQLLLEIYCSYFKVKVFNLFVINWIFTFNLTLFILNYIILVAQTSST